MNTFFGSVFIARITVSSRNTWTSSHVTWLLWIVRLSGWEKRVASTSMNSSMSRNPCLTRKKKRSANEIHSSHRSPSTSRIWVDVAAANNHRTSQNRRYNILRTLGCQKESQVYILYFSVSCNPLYNKPLWNFIMFYYADYNNILQLPNQYIHTHAYYHYIHLEGCELSDASKLLVDYI